MSDTERYPPGDYRAPVPVVQPGYGFKTMTDKLRVRVTELEAQVVKLEDDAREVYYLKYAGLVQESPNEKP